MSLTDGTLVVIFHTSPIPLRFRYFSSLSYPLIIRIVLLLHTSMTRPVSIVSRFSNECKGLPVTNDDSTLVTYVWCHLKDDIRVVIRSVHSFFPLVVCVVSFLWYRYYVNVHHSSCFFGVTPSDNETRRLVLRGVVGVTLIREVAVRGLRTPTVSQWTGGGWSSASCQTLSRDQFVPNGRFCFQHSPFTHLIRWSSPGSLSLRVIPLSLSAIRSLSFWRSVSCTRRQRFLGTGYVLVDGLGHYFTFSW